MDKLKVHKLANVLLKTIETTAYELENLKGLKDEAIEDYKHRSLDNELHDGLYSLHIGKYRDGSGKSADLSRYGGNMELLEVIIETLEKQLEDYEKMFDKLYNMTDKEYLDFVHELIK